MKSITFLILGVLALLSSVATAKRGNSRFHSAKCLSMKRKCTPTVAAQSGSCVSGRYARNQSRACHTSACAWCKLRNKTNRYPCTAKNVRSICRAVAAGRTVKRYDPKNRRRSSPPATRPPTTRPPPPKPEFRPNSGTAPSRGCTYSGSDRVVVDLGKVSMASGWTRTSRGGLTGVVYDKNGGGGVVPAKSATTMCFKMKVSVAGDYVATAVSAAPHPTEHNDMWVSFDKDVQLLRFGKFKSGGRGKFLKGYQNTGGNRFAGNLNSIDHDPHTFVLVGLGSGTVVKYCMSGRSSKYEVFKLIIAKCGGSKCLSGLPSAASLISASPSKCT